MIKPESILIALGGNAMIPPKSKGTIQEQERVINTSAMKVAQAIADIKKVVITHGNGPTVGDILLRNELSSNVLPVMPLYICGADSQGELGYLIQSAFYNAFKKIDKKRTVVSLITQVLVDKNDINFKHPTKPIGKRYSKTEAQKLMKENNWIMKKTDRDINGREKYRRVVPSPIPVKIIECDAIKSLIEQGIITIAVGGGGIPVIIDENDNLRGIDAVIDKDRASALLANSLGIEFMIILTNIKKVCLNYGKLDEKSLDVITLDEAKRYYNEGHFESGSMGPKIESAITFLSNGGKKVIIGDLNEIDSIIQQKSGTIITLNL